ncbi:MAG: PLP-dependent aminotransferase family protein [Labilithrix sp.]|nr:PLP-dependent aminotransferase family protein [Labilithrix sp.]
MASWSVTIDLTRGDENSPTFVRIARAIAGDIRRGRLRAGDALPGTRTLAASLGVHRNTVLAAYRELFAEGWIASEKARGTFVSVEIPEPQPKRFSAGAAEAREIAARPGYDVVDPARGRDRGAGALTAEAPARVVPAPLPRGRGGVISKDTPMTLGGGVPDVRLVPAGELARALRRVLRRSPLDVLSYGDPEGPVALRRAVAKMVSATRGVAAREDHVLVARGSQMGVDLVARTLLAPGDAVAVEALGYRPAWEALRASGARLVPVPVDAHGIDVAALERLAAAERIRGVYVTPHHQFPTTTTLAPARRVRLLDLARERRFWVLEDDYDHEFHYEGRPVLPLASADVHGVVVYVGTLSKVLAPGMRIGFVVAPVPVIERLAATRRIVDRQGDHLLETAIAELVEEGEVQRHVRRAKRVYAERRARLASLLEAELGGVLSFALPSGGTAIWARVAGDVPVDVWAARALDQEALALQSARQFAFDGRSRPFLRLGFAQHEEREAREAIRRMVSALPRRGAGRITRQRR